MSEVTHCKGEWGFVSRCGLPQKDFVDNPTCLLCIGLEDENNWMLDEIIANSVKDIQEAEDKKYADEVDVLIEFNKAWS